MASLEALLRAYKLQAGDVVYVDTGNYTQLYDIVFGAEDSGSSTASADRVRIQGPTGAAQAVLNRDARVSTAPSSASRGRISSPCRSGNDRCARRRPVRLSAGSNDISILNSQIYGNTNAGISFDSSSSAQLNRNIEVGGTRIFNHATVTGSTAISRQAI